MRVTAAVVVEARSPPAPSVASHTASRHNSAVATRAYTAVASVDAPGRAAAATAVATVSASATPTVRHALSPSSSDVTTTAAAASHRAALTQFAPVANRGKGSLQ